jgi:hypothetical protein
MGIFSSRPGSDGTPNDKPYKLIDENGDRFVMRHGGVNQNEFTLAAAIDVADMEAGNGIQLYVVDPETGTVLWAGQRAMR